eukprot:1194220-Prorocentrum_minimum.AAC.4
MNVFKNDSQSSAPVVFIYPRAFLKITPELEFRWHQAWQGNNSQGDLPVQRSLTVKHSRRESHQRIARVTPRGACAGFILACVIVVGFVQKTTRSNGAIYSICTRRTCGGRLVNSGREPRLMRFSVEGLFRARANMARVHFVKQLFDKGTFKKDSA